MILSNTYDFTADLNPFEFSPWTFPILLSSSSLIIFGFLYKNRKLPNILNTGIKFILNFEISKKLSIIIGILIKLSSKGPVLFKQLRSGVNNEDFMCYKFRSMRISSDSDVKQATVGDSRLTRIGAFLRKTSIDEFPQFLNVLMGDMSIVGPRPHMLLHTEEYSVLIKKYMVRQLVKPGITGVAQVRGYRGETKELEDMEGRVRFDVWYIENWSLSLDINIVFQTISEMFINVRICSENFGTFPNISDMFPNNSEKRKNSSEHFRIFRKTSEHFRTMFEQSRGIFPIIFPELSRSCPGKFLE